MRCRGTAGGTRTDGDAETGSAEGGGGEVGDDQRARHMDFTARADLRGGRRERAHERDEQGCREGAE